MFTLIDRHHTGRRVMQALAMGLGLVIGGMGLARNAMSQEQSVNPGTETPAAIQTPSSASGQSDNADTGTTPLLSPEQLEGLVAPIALYPDALISIIIPASTYPLQVVQAVRFLKQQETDPDLQVDEEWDDSIVALLNYPDVLNLMDADLDWTGDLGAAVLNQQEDVMTAIQQFRQRAFAAGNLTSDDKQLISDTGGAIEIRTADPEVIYIPDYEPAEVIVYQSRPVYRYYPVAYPVYYYPYQPDYRFRNRSFWGLQTVFSIGWDTHCINVFPHDYYQHPYYGSTFYFDYYRDNYRRSRRYRNRDVNINVNLYNQGRTADHRWRPDRDGGDQRLFNRDEQHRQRNGADNQRSADQQPQQDVETVDPTQEGTLRTLSRPEPINSAPRLDPEEAERLRANQPATVQSMPRSRQRDITDDSAVRTLTRPEPIHSAPRVEEAVRLRANRPQTIQSRPRPEQVDRTLDNTVRTLTRPEPIHSAPRVEEADRLRANRPATVQSMPRSRQRDITDDSAVRTLTRPEPIHSAPRVEEAVRLRANRPQTIQSRPRPEQVERTLDNTVRTLSRPEPIHSAPRAEEAGSSYANQAAMSPPRSQPEPDADAQNADAQNGIHNQSAGSPSRSDWKNNARRHLR